MHPIEWKSDQVITQRADDEIRTRPCPECSLCGAQGGLLYQGLQDRLFGSSGEWNFKKCLNSECGLVWLDPMPIEEDIGKAYQDYYTHQAKPDESNKWFRRAYHLVKEGYLAHKYGYYHGSFISLSKFLGILTYLQPALRADLDFCVMYLPPHPKGRLLEVGCGNGKVLKSMAEVGWRVEGVDFDPIAVEKAKRDGLQVHFGTLEAQEYPKSHFDAITMSHLIEHVHHPLRLLGECHRILKPGGRLVIVTPNNESWGHRIFGGNWRGLEPPRHLHLFTIQSLLRITENAGFQKLRAWTSIRGGSWLFMASRSVQIKGKYTTGSPQPVPIHLWARCMQLAEWLILKVNPLAGEEIGLVVKK